MGPLGFPSFLRSAKNLELGYSTWMEAQIFLHPARWQNVSLYMKRTGSQRCFPVMISVKRSDIIVIRGRHPGMDDFATLCKNFFICLTTNLNIDRGFGRFGGCCRC